MNVPDAQSKGCGITHRASSHGGQPIPLTSSSDRHCLSNAVHKEGFITRKTQEEEERNQQEKGLAVDERRADRQCWAVVIGKRR